MALFTALLIYLSVVCCGPAATIQGSIKSSINGMQNANTLEAETSNELTVRETSMNKKDSSESFAEKEEKTEPTLSLPNCSDEEDDLGNINYVEPARELHQWLDGLKGVMEEVNGGVIRIHNRDFPTKIVFYGKAYHGTDLHWDLHRHPFRFFAWPEGFALIGKKSTDLTPGAILKLIIKRKKERQDYRELVREYSSFDGNLIGVFGERKRLYLHGHRPGYRVFACRKPENRQPDESLCDVLLSTGKNYKLSPFVSLLIAPSVLRVDEAWNTSDPALLAESAAKQIAEDHSKTVDVFVYSLHPESGNLE